MDTVLSRIDRWSSRHDSLRQVKESLQAMGWEKVSITSDYDMVIAQSPGLVLYYYPDGNENHGVLPGGYIVRQSVECVGNGLADPTSARSLLGKHLS